MADMDPRVKLECLLDAYRLHHARAKKQGFMDAEYGYLQSLQFNRGQEFVLENVIQDLELLLKLMEDSADD